MSSTSLQNEQTYKIHSKWLNTPNLNSLTNTTHSDFYLPPRDYLGCMTEEAATHRGVLLFESKT